MYNYITTLNNFFYAFDKYSKSYSKENISQSTYPDVFYLLKNDELNIGINKGLNLLKKVNLPNNLLLKIETNPENNGFIVHKNTKNGLGYFIKNNSIKIEKLYISNSVNSLEDNIKWLEVSVEDAFALSLKINQLERLNYDELSPLSFSFLPIAIACQAKCKFCFSHSSISSEQIKNISDYDKLINWMNYSVQKGAKRFVITGGGDPGIWGIDNLINVIKLAKNIFSKKILFSNGIFLEKNQTDNQIINNIHQLKQAGLDTLSLSVHHYETSNNTFIMGVDTKFNRLISIYKTIPKDKKPNIRLICVLQKNGINNASEIQKFIQFAADNDINEICFKELYVSSGLESLYSTLESNIYSEQNQVSLSVITDYAKSLNLIAVNKLPWGSPIFEFNVDNKIIKVAAYTEPTLGWEKTNGIARSWNYLSDKKCYVSLEDNTSNISLINQS